MPLLLIIVLTYTIPVVSVFSYQVVVLIVFVVQLKMPRSFIKFSQLILKGNV